MDKTLQHLIILVILVLTTPIKSISGENFKIWDISNNPEESIMIFKSIELSEDEMTPQAVLDLVFQQVEQEEYEEDECYFRVFAVINGIAYVAIEGDAELITNRSGSAGATYYQVVIIFNLTEFEDINSVWFCDEGEHFVSGEFERIDFWYYMSEYRKKKNIGLAVERLTDIIDSFGCSIYLDLLTEVGDEQTLEDLENLLSLNEKSKNNREKQILESIEKIKNRLDTSR